MSDSRRRPKGGELVAVWILLALWLVAFAGRATTFVRQWRAIGTSDLSAFYSNWLTVATVLALLCAWVMAVVLAARLRRWGWLVACALLFVAAPVFAVLILVEGRTGAADRMRQASFESAMAQALLEQEAERSRGNAEP